jgi:hypothetical protein
MRAVMLTVLVVGACAPDIVPGAYLCGPERLCPQDQVCDGVTDMCVSASAAMPFACGKTTEVEPNNGAASAEVIPNLPCVSLLTEIKGCTPDGDTEDWYSFDVPTTCGATIADLHLQFPIAFEELVVELAGGQGTFAGSPADCSANLGTDSGNTDLCVKHPVTAGGHYSVRVARSGQGNCGGECGFNRYTLTLQLGTP